MAAAWGHLLLSGWSEGKRFALQNAGSWFISHPAFGAGTGNWEISLIGRAHPENLITSENLNDVMAAQGSHWRSIGGRASCLTADRKSWVIMVTRGKVKAKSPWMKMMRQFMLAISQSVHEDDMAGKASDWYYSKMSFKFFNGLHQSQVRKLILQTLNRWRLQTIDMHRGPGIPEIIGAQDYRRRVSLRLMTEENRFDDINFRGTRGDQGVISLMNM